MQDSGLNMDIEKWLVETEQPVPSEQPGFGTFLLPRQPGSVPDAGRRQKHSLSDSSWLQVPSPRPQRKGISAIEQDRHDVRDKYDRSNASHSTRSESRSISAASQRYVRRPRRKTHPDRYEVGPMKVKQQDRNPHPSRKSESRKSKRKSKRRKDNKMYNGIGQDFHAKNVSMDRLTVRVLHML
jgi:hypothetical protein